jgi:hypothetical protein
VRFTGGVAARRGALALLIGLLALAVLTGGVVAFRRRGQRLPPAEPAAQPDLIGALARLDAQYAGRRESVRAEEWEAYQRERARLKFAAEAAALARRRPWP